MDKRHIPEKNLLLLWMTDKTSCSREDYDKKVVVPVRRYLEKEENKQIRCIVSMFGLPLTIGSKDLSQAEKLQLDSLDAQKETILQQINGRQFSNEEVIIFAFRKYRPVISRVAEERFKSRSFP